MSTNGRTNGRTNDGEVDPSDPFARGVWVLTMLSGADAIALVDGSEGREEEVQNEMIEQQEKRGFILVDLRRKTLLKELVFPLQERTPSGQATGRLMPGNLPSASRHENTIELTKDFVTHAVLFQLTFLAPGSEMPPENMGKLRESVVNAERGAEEYARVIRSNIISPNGMDLR